MLRVRNNLCPLFLQGIPAGTGAERAAGGLYKHGTRFALLNRMLHPEKKERVTHVQGIPDHGDISLGRGSP